MASARDQKPACPICDRADQVKTMQSAYDSGVEACAPPDVPTKKVSMLPYIAAGAVAVGICLIVLLVLFGGLEGNIPEALQFVLVSVTLVCIIGSLVASYIAFQRVVKGDNEANERLPQWEQAMTIWRGLYYCARDKVVFNPQSQKIVSNEQLAELRSMSAESVEVKAAAIARQQS
ncbi:MAG: hypothetical protein IMW89_00300 [Ktedonobacteraceae bacterium]|nr:hypothetical protein [Ktedonobacteraceae bacterium]